MNMFVSDLECESYVETSDSDDQDDSESTYGGHAQSILSSLDESIGKIDDFLAYERGFLHGDIVCSINEPTGQLGRVVNVDMTVDLEAIYGHVIKNVNSKKLQRLRCFACGDYVVHGPWLGRVDGATDVATVLFDDGTRCEIMTEDTDVLIPVSPILFEDAPYPYYPGQRVRVNVPTISKSMQWLCGLSKSNRDEGTVCHVEVGLVHVNWIASVLISQGVISSTPNPLQDPENLTLLSCFQHTNWQVGDWCTLMSNSFNSLQMTAEKSYSSSNTPQFLTKTHKIFGSSDQYHKQIYVIGKTKTKVDILWQNGSHSLGEDSQTILPVNIVGEHDFWPEQFVLEKVISEDINLLNEQRLGIVKNVDAEERIVKVKWTAPEIKLENSNEEIVSAYELIEHPTFSYCMGDVVFRLLPHLGHAEEKFQDVQTDGQRHEVPLSNMSNSSLLSTKDTIAKNFGEGATCYLSCIGNVIGFKDEAIEVKWANGLVSKVHPSEIFGLDKFDDPPSAAVNEESVQEIVIKDMAAQGKQSCMEEEQAVNNYEEDSIKDVWDPRQFTHAAIGFLTNVATTIFSSSGYSSVSGPWKGDSELQVLTAEEPKLDIDDLQTDILKQVEDRLKGQPTFSPSVKQVKFMQFDIVDDASDHHFVDGISKGMLSSQVKRGWLKKVQQEWINLRKDLPENIYVRVYEERTDILRACIVGAPGTPYHDGLFFFDIFLPPDYPQEPPLVHYNSGGLRLNPNLYDSGKVCLSLLKTWVGSGTEVWNPESSTILQVLLSLQALVLNDKPYFNEAGYDQQMGKAEGEKNSITYNENAFLLSCKSMMYILHKPPKHFELLVEEHFAQRSHGILLACKAYMDGAQVGRALEDGNIQGEGLKSCSTGFKILLAKLFLKMIACFTERGIDCSQFITEVKLICNTSII